MRYSVLGSTNTKISKLCLGTMTWGFQNTELQAHEQLDYALAHGINFIDTAEIYAVPPSQETYGKTETYIGNRIKSRGGRDRYILASKVAGPNMSYIRHGVGLTRDSILSAIDGSLARLQTDYIDLYQLHRPQRPVPLRGQANYQESMYHKDTSSIVANIHEVLETLQEIIQSGKVRYIGLSNETARGVMQFLNEAKTYNLPRIQTIQNAYNVVRRDYESSLMEISLHEQVGLLAYSPLARGVLSGKYLIPGDQRGTLDQPWGKERYGYYLNDRVTNTLHRLRTIAEESGTSLVQLCLAFAHNRRFVDSVIIGCRSLTQLGECISSADIVLSPKICDRIDAIYRDYPNPVLF